MVKQVSKFKKIAVFAVSFILAFLSAGFFSVFLPVKSDDAKPIKNVILFIGDGMGQNHVKAGEIYKGAPLSFQNFEMQGLNVTASQSVLEGLAEYTDSAAGGTAMATGFKTYNDYVAVDSQKRELTSFTDIAKSKGMKTGVVSSDEIDGATPSAFLSHADYRKDSAKILDTMSKRTSADLIIGQRPTNLDTYLSAFERYAFNFADSHKKLTKNTGKLLATFPIFARDLGYEVAFLDDLVAFSLDYLDNDNGFFLMVEGANIDKRSHLDNVNKGTWMVKELMNFDESVQTAIDWAAGRDDTLILVTADHETGGLTIGEGANSQNLISKLNFATCTHTNSDVFYFAYGYRSQLMKSKIDNTDIFKIMCESIGAAYAA